MNIKEIKEIISTKEYSFLDDNEHLGSNIIMIGLGGSHAYGTNIETSDLDIRGIALNRKEDILTNNNFEQFVNEETDTTIYSFNKIISLLSNSNPNTVEILGLKPEHYIYINEIGKELLDNKKLFLSKRAYYSFGGYATSQLRRLDNKAVRLVEQEEREKHIYNSIMNAKYTFKDKYSYLEDDNINLYIDKSNQEEYDSEIFMDINFKHYPLRDYKSMWSEMQNIVKDYSKLGKRNQNAIEHNKLGKHMMHLIRLYIMCLDILEKEEINTFIDKDHDLLMELRNGKYLDSNRQPIKDFFDMVSDYEKRLDYAKKNTSLPENPDYKKINDFMFSVNERIIKDNV